MGAAAADPVLEPSFAVTRCCGSAFGPEAGSRPPKVRAEQGRSGATSPYTSEHRAMPLLVNANVGLDSDR